MKRLFSTTAVFALASAIAFATNLALARLLAPSGYAVYLLLFNLFTFAAMLGDAGLMQKYLRFFLKHETGTFHWPRILLSDLPLPLLLVGTCGLVFLLLFPQVAPVTVGLVLLSSLGYLLTQWLTAILRSVSQAWWVAALQRGFPFGLLGFVPLLAAAEGQLAWATALSFLAINTATALMAIGACSRQLAPGSEALPEGGHADGWSLFLLLAGVSIFFYGDKFIVARLCRVEDFAAYGLAAAFFQVFDLLNLSMGFVLAPFYAKAPSRSSLRIFRVTLALLLPVGLVGVLVVPLAIGWAYPHFPPISRWMLVGLAAAGIGKVLNGVIMSDLNLNATSAMLRRYALQNTAFLGLGLPLVAMGAMRFGVVGASLATGSVWIGRVLLSLFTERRAHSLREAIA